MSSYIDSQSESADFKELEHLKRQRTKLHAACASNKRNIIVHWYRVIFLVIFLGVYLS